MIRVVVPDDFPPVLTGSEACRRLAQAVDLHVHTEPYASSNTLRERLAEAHTAIVLRSHSKLIQAVLQATRGLRHIAIWGTGTDNVDLTAARSLGVVVSNTPNVSTDSVAEHSLALMFAVARKITELDRKLREGLWVRPVLSQLHGKKLGVIGTGRIGCRTAQLGLSVGMQVQAWSFNPSAAKAAAYGFDYVPLDVLLQDSDIISVHLRSTPQTEEFIDAEKLAKLKPSAILVNTARGSLVDEDALLEALAQGRLAGAGLDVFSVEPLPDDHPFLQQPKLVLTPHSAAGTRETIDRGLSMVVDNVILFATEGRVNHQVA